MSILDRLEGSKEAQAWIRQNANYENDWCCLIWPFGRSQGGYAGVGGKHTYVHRIMCEVRNGPPPTPKHQAAHSCERGHDGCVNPLHLSWKTASENQLDRYRGRPPAPARKITHIQAEEIRAMEGRAQVAELATMYGVSEANIRKIFAGQIWKNTAYSRKHLFTDEEVRRIRSTSWAEEPASKFAKQYGVNINVIHRIRNRASYKYVADVAHGGGAAS